MICPYCNKEMEKGNIQNRYTLAWYPGHKTHFFMNPDFHKGAVTIAEDNMITGAKCTAYLCRECLKVIIDLEEADE